MSDLAQGGTSRGAGSVVAALSIVSAVAVAPPAHADPGRDALDAVRERNGIASWRDRTLDITIESYGGDDVTRSRTGELVERNDPDGGHRTFIEFTSPSDVQGALYLHLRPRHGEEEEWLWSPQTRRPRRLSPGQPNEITTGLDLGYRDLAALTRVLQWMEGEASVATLRTESLGDRACQVLEVRPTATGAEGELPYTRYRLWIDQADMLPRKAELLDDGGTTPKVLLFDDYETIAGHATARRVELVEPQGDRRTVFLLSDVRYDSGVRDGTFSLARLNRGR